MTLEELFGDEAVRCREFPIVQREIFLANAAICPFPNRVGSAMRGLVDRAVRASLEFEDYDLQYEEARGYAASLLGCAPDNIALLGPTSIGLSLVANGLPFEPGDNVVFYHADYPSNAVVWMNLLSRGVELRTVEVEEPGAIGIDHLRPLVDSRTRLVALSSAHFVGGYRLDLASVGEWIKSRGVLFCVDGIQTLGAVRTCVEGVDFLCADAHKWLLGPSAIGVFYVSPESMERLEPTLLGWNNVVCPDFITPQTIVYKKDASRYEAGSPNLVGLFGLLAALKLLIGFGIEEVEKRVVEHTRRIRESVLGKGYQLACADGERLSGITSFRKEGVDIDGLYLRLKDAGVVPSLRGTPDGHKWIRFSPHCYNTADEIDAALELL